MINTLLIGKHIYKILSESESVSKYVGKKIYPIVCESGTKFPFIVFNRNDVTTTYSKDGIIKDVVTFEINVIAETYFESCTIANEVRHLFELSLYNSEELKITKINLTNVSEGYSENAFVQTLTFSFDIK